MLFFNFKRFMKEKEGDKLVAQCNEVINEVNENIKGFQRYSKTGSVPHFQTVYEGFELNWNNEPIDG